MTVSFDFQDWVHRHLQGIEAALQHWVTADVPQGVEHGAPFDLVEAMRYAVLDGGKRLRPLLVMAAFEATSGQRSTQYLNAALRAACSAELIHAYSLVHDDMPCMDNDVLRRGKPTVHVQFGEASALQALAFELLTPDTDDVPASVQARLCALLSRAAGSAGMAGGQAIDLASVGHQLTETQLRTMHQLKTGALLKCSVLMGAVCGIVEEKAYRALTHYGDAMGLAFQVVDDILDVTADSNTLGKTAGKDAHNDKPTYVSLMGLEGSAAYAQVLLLQALAALQDSGLPDTEALRSLADMVVNRGH
jgi:farnesyl diphosphate synthase